MTKQLSPLTPDDTDDLLDIITSWNICDANDPETILTLGYRFLTEGEKTTYTFMKKLAKPDTTSSGGLLCRASTNYIAICLGTSDRCQQQRILSLKKAALLKCETSGSFIMFPPVLEETFKETILKLLFRKELSWRISLIKSAKTYHIKLANLSDLEKFINTNKTHPQFLDIISSAKTDPNMQQYISMYM